MEQGLMKTVSSDARGKHNKKDITGKQFGRLKAICPTDKRDNRSVVWECQCVCGKMVYVSAARLNRGNSKSCGCLKKEVNEAIGKQKFLDNVEGTCIQRIQNKNKRNDNTSGFRGVSRFRDSQWMAYIGFKGKRHHLGVFDNYHDAVKARIKAEEKMYEPFLEKYTKK